MNEEKEEHSDCSTRILQGTYDRYDRYWLKYDYDGLMGIG